MLYFQYNKIKQYKKKSFNIKTKTTGHRKPVSLINSMASSGKKSQYRQHQRQSNNVV